MKHCYFALVAQSVMPVVGIRLSGVQMVVPSRVRDELGLLQCGRIGWIKVDFILADSG
jgi:hypothetical protein